MSTATKERTKPRGADRKRRRKGKDEDAEERARPNVAERAAVWDPDKRWFHPFIGTLTTYTLGGMPAWAGLSPWLMLPAGLGLTGAAMYAARHTYGETEYGQQQARSATALSGAAGVTATSWLVWAGQPDITPLNPTALGTLLLGGGLFGALYSALRGKAPERRNAIENVKAEAKRQHDEARHERQVHHKVELWQPIIDRAGLTGVKVYDWAETKAGEVLHLIDSPEKPLKLAGVQEACPNIASIAAHALAHQGVKLQTNQVRAEEGDAAHLFKLHISTKNRFARDMSYPMDRPVQSIEQPIRPGVFEDDEDLALTVVGTHLFMVGATGSGKDVFTNNCVAETTRTNNAKVWIGGTAKLMPQIWPWLAPWFRGLTDRPLLDRVAGENPTQVGRMLADLYKIGTQRNKKLGPLSKHHPTPTDPAYVGVLVEGADFLRDHDTMRIKTFDGRTWSPSALLDVITRAFRSAGVGVVMVSQYGLMDGSGSYGSYMMRNFTIRVAGKTMSHSDGTNTLVGLRGTDTTKLRNYTLLVQPNVEEPRSMPAKAFLLDGEQQIQPVAVRNTGNQARSPEWIENISDEHRNRWNQDEHPELAEIVEGLGLSWPSLPGESAGTMTPSEPSADEDEAAAEETEPAPESAWPEPEYTQMTQEEIDQLMQQAEEKFTEARDDLQRWGILGETMHKVHEVVKAENAPAWVPAGQLAFVIERVDQAGDWDAAGAELISELRAAPWHLEPETGANGEPGWRRQTIIDRINSFVTGEAAAPMELPEQQQTEQAPESAPQHPLLHAAHVLRDRPVDAWVTTAELAQLMGRVSPEMDASEKRSIQTRMGRELGQFVESKRTSRGTSYQVGTIIETASSVSQ